MFKMLVSTRPVKYEKEGVAQPNLMGSLLLCFGGRKFVASSNLKLNILYTRNASKDIGV